MTETVSRRCDGVTAAPRNTLAAEWARPILVVAAALPLHLALALGTDLSPDEAYYLCAARRSGLVPDLVDHPPLLPWLLRLSDHFGGPVELRVRVWAILFSAVTGLAVVALARRFGARREGALAAAWIGTWALLPMTGGFVTTPDGAALLAVAVALLVVERPRGLPIAGAALFVGALAKVVVLPIALVLAFAEVRRDDAAAGRGRRRGLARAAMLIVGPALSLPLLAPSLRFQLHHAFTQTASAGWSPLLAVGAAIAAIFAQALLWSPPTLGLATRGLRRIPFGPRVLAATLSALVLASALARGVPPEPNWWAPAALVVVAAAALAAEELSARTRRRLVLALLVPTLIAAAHTLRPFLPLAQATDPTARLHGWTRGEEPTGAPGVGPYGLAAERCIYRNQCSEIDNYFNNMDINP